MFKRAFGGLPTLISIALILATVFVCLAVPWLFLVSALEGWDNYLKNTTQLEVAKEGTKQTGIEWRHRENIARINADKDLSVAEIEHKATFGFNFRWILQSLVVIVVGLFVVDKIERFLRKRRYIG